MCLCADTVSDLLQAESEGGSAKAVLLLSESVRSDGILLWFLYSGDLQNRILYDCGPGISSAGVAVGDEKGVVSESVPCGSGRSVLRLFCIFAQGYVCHGYSAAALSELDF